MLPRAPSAGRADLANLIFQILDMRILKIAQTYRLDYTRYADDLTFSTNDRSFPEHYERFLKSVTAELGRGGFAVNQKKTRPQFRDSRQEVTGLVINQKIHVSQEYYKQTRAMAHHMYTQGSCMLQQPYRQSETQRECAKCPGAAVSGLSLL